MILYLFAFISGLVTILAPCIWPILPIVFAVSSGGKKKSIGVAIGIVLSFTFFTLSLSLLVSVLPIDPELFRYLASIILVILGVSMVYPPLATLMEGYISRWLSKVGRPMNQANSDSFGKGLASGLALGTVWTPCAGPILASIAAAASTQALNSQIVLTAVIYGLGVFIPLLGFSLFGARLQNKLRSLGKSTGTIQKIFGVVVIVFALLIATGYDKDIQAGLLDLVPQYSDFIYKLESNPQVLEELRGTKEKGDVINSGQTNSKLRNLGKAPEIVGINNWLNTKEPLTLEKLKGRVVLVDFWTYTCINCIRTLPFVTSWYEKYKDYGFVVLGVHSPEFEFEKKTSNVRSAVEKYNITYPVAQDNDFATWRNYNNRYWPAHYLIDKDGTIRMVHFGEGKYSEMEEAIQELLQETSQFQKTELLELEDTSPKSKQTPELYVGLTRLARNFSSSETPEKGERVYTYKNDIAVNSFGLSGVWNHAGEYAQTVENSKLKLNFQAQKVFLVLESDRPAMVEIYYEGKRTQTIEGTLNDAYTILELPEVTRGETEIVFRDAGVRVFAFTFGS